MENYVVVKYFGHFLQRYEIRANSEEDAWNRAEEDGHLTMQSFYSEIFKGSGYVKNIETNKQSRISSDDYNMWLREAIELGMKVTEEEYKTAYEK